MRASTSASMAVASTSRAAACASRAAAAAARRRDATGAWFARRWGEDARRARWRARLGAAGMATRTSRDATRSRRLRSGGTDRSRLRNSRRCSSAPPSLEGKTTKHARAPRANVREALPKISKMLRSIATTPRRARRLRSAPSRSSTRAWTTAKACSTPRWTRDGDGTDTGRKLSWNLRARPSRRGRRGSPRKSRRRSTRRSSRGRRGTRRTPLIPQSWWSLRWWRCARARRAPRRARRRSTPPSPARRRRRGGASRAESAGGCAKRRAWCASRRGTAQTTHVRVTPATAVATVVAPDRPLGYVPRSNCVREAEGRRRRRLRATRRARRRGGAVSALEAAGGRGLDGRRRRRGGEGRGRPRRFGRGRGAHRHTGRDRNEKKSGTPPAGSDARSARVGARGDGVWRRRRVRLRVDETGNVRRRETPRDAERRIDGARRGGCFRAKDERDGRGTDIEAPIESVYNAQFTTRARWRARRPARTTRRLPTKIPPEYVLYT